MKLPDSCKQCKKPKTVHLSQVVGNKVEKLDVCEECPLVASLEAGTLGWSSAPVIAVGDAPISQGLEEEKCPICGYTLSRFKKTGRMGCPRCYQFYWENIRSLLPDMHRGIAHSGKVPRARRESIDLRQQIQDLHQRMKEAVLREGYEEAAQLRDRISDLKEQLGASEHPSSKPRREV